MTRSLRLGDEMVSEADVVDVTSFMNYASQQLGVAKPVGIKGRALAMARIQDEMAEQQWGWKHMTAAVRFMKARGIKARTHSYILHFVGDAIQHGYLTKPKTSTWDALYEQVSVAIHQEEDPTWIRRLASAKGQALVQVYAKWQQERSLLGA